MYLGLDISTSCTAFSVLDQSGNLVLVSHEFPETTPGEFPYEEALTVSTNIYEKCKQYDIQAIFIENPLSKFASGKSTAAVISTLVRFNSLISYELWKLFGIKPEHIPFTQARTKLGIKPKKKEKGQRVTDREKKEPYLNWALDRHPSFVISLNRAGNINMFHYDEADSLVIATAGYLCQNKTT